MIVAFEGWNDAGDAATAAVEYLAEQWHATQFAEIDPEEFYDFTSTRPQVRSVQGVGRILDWPSNTFSWARPVARPRPGASGGLDQGHAGGVVLVRGVEPQLKWRTFSEQVRHVATMLDCSMVLTLGALLADVAHTRPTPVFGNAYDQAVLDRWDLESSHYEGPTGIVGVLHAECDGTNLDSAALWAAVPAYVPSAPSAKAALALVHHATDLIGVQIDTSELEASADEYELEISALVAEDDSTAEYVRHLEEQHDRNAGAVRNADDLVEEVEKFLREQ